MKQIISNDLRGKLADCRQTQRVEIETYLSKCTKNIIIKKCIVDVGVNLLFIYFSFAFLDDNKKYTRECTFHIYFSIMEISNVFLYNILTFLCTF